MDRQDYFKIGGLGAIAVLLLVFTTIEPRKVKAAWRQAKVWFQSGAWIIPVVVIGVLLVVAVVGVRLRKRAAARRYHAEIDARVADGPTVLLLPRSDWKPVAPGKVNLWGRLADALPHDEHLSFEVFGNDTEIAFALHASEAGLRAALTQFKAEWPGMGRRDVEEDPAQLPDGWAIWWCECEPATWDAPIEVLSSDPLRGVLVELNSVIGRGRGLLQVIARGDFGTRRAVGQKAVQTRGEGGQIPHAGVRALRQKEARMLEKRFDRTFLQATIRTVGMADTPERAQGIARGLARAVTAAFAPGNPVKRVREGQAPAPVLARQMGQAQAWGDNELVYLAHLVGQDMQAVAPRLKVASAKSLPVAPPMRVTSTDQVARFAQE